MSLKDLLIPPIEGTAQRLAAWRLSIAGAIIGAWFVIFYILTTYATASELSATRSEVTDVKAMLISQKIDQVQTALCLRPGDPELIDFLRDLKEKHIRDTGRSYESPACSLLLRVQR